MSENNNLPIRIFEKRSNMDERSTEGGGSRELPKWVLNGSELEQKAIVLSEDINGASDKIEKKITKYKGLPSVIKAKINEDAVAKSHRKELNNFFTVNKENNRFIGVSGNKEILIRVDNIQQLNEIENNAKDFQRYNKAVSGIENIDSFEPHFDLEFAQPDSDGKFIVKIILFDFNNFQLNQATFNTFKEVIDGQSNLEYIKTVKYSRDLYVHEVSTDSIQTLRVFEDFSPVMSIEPMPIIEVIEDDFFTSGEIDLPLPIKDADYPIIGVLDSGISDIQALKPWKYDSRHSNYPNNYLNPNHGTFVAGILNFGDILEKSEYTGTNGFKLLDAAVFPDQSKESITEGDLINNIREVVNIHSEQVKVWNLSLGTKTEIKNSEFSSLGIALDSIQDEYEILIIKSAGNCTNFLSNNPTSKIARGADSTRAITVGSIAHSKTDFDVADYNHPSPFSRVGPGPVNIIKPELVHYGGNFGINKGKHIPNGIISLDSNGKIVKNVGTSFSTPRVTAIAADLSSKLNEEFDPILIKALLLHSAKYPNEVDLDINDKLNQMGFGIPSKSNEILYNNPNEITLILRDSLNKGEFVEILDFPYPPSLVENGHYYGQIFVTLVNSPILVGTQGPEYCQSDLQVSLGTYNEKTKRDTSKPTIINPIGRNESKNILTTDIYSKKISKVKEGFPRSEKTLVQYGDKYYPNKKYAIDLSDATQTKKERYLGESKNWYLKVNGVFREYAETKAELERKSLSQDFCIVITIRDPYAQKPVYNEVSQLLDTNNFIHRNIKVSQDINISLD